jgi:type IV pilus assembly protein PilW
MISIVPGARRAAGFSLIELMIALLIGTLLLIGLVQVFGASRSAYQLSQGIARSQENARFGLDFLSRDLRMAGHAGCVNDQSLLAEAGGTVTGGNIRSLFMTNAQRAANDVSALPFPLRFDMALQGFEANGTSPGDAVALATVPGVGAAADWTPALPAELAALSPIAGSDIVVLRYLSPEHAPVSGLTVAASSTINYPAATGAVATGGNGLYALADCGGASVFQASAAPSGTGMTVAVGGLNQSELGAVSGHDGAITYKAGGATLYRAESIAYYVALNAQNVPALFRARWGAAPGGAALSVTTEELVEGVESLQLLYGEDSNSEDLTQTPSGHITKTNTAATIGGAANAGRWRRTGAVQLGLMVRGGGGERAAAEQAQAAQNVLQVEMTAPDDGHYRSVYETTIALRNRLFGN